MFEHLKEKFLNMITSREFLLMIVMIAVASVMIHRVFELQIVHGEDYIDSFQMKIKKERTIAGSRGCIYDKNGNLLAYNELAHSVTIEDVYESGKMKNYNLNTTIHTLVQMIQKNGDHIVSDFKITLDKNNHYAFTVEGTTLKRFLADVYGKRNIEDLEEKQSTATAQEVVDYLCGWERFRIGEYTRDTTNELEELQAKNPDYDMNDTVGKLGIEKSMETQLQGIKGNETIFVNSVGKVTETMDYHEPIAGNDVYLTIDKDLQIAAYKILEEELASILYTNIINAKDFDASKVTSSKIKIPIDDVYFALLDNNVIDISHFTDPNAGVISRFCIRFIINA